MDIVVQIAQLLLMLSILVILHEFGHYIAAKIFKVRVEKFYLFMDAGFALFKKKIKYTEWGIGWLPLGGYVNIMQTFQRDGLRQIELHNHFFGQNGKAGRVAN